MQQWYVPRPPAALGRLVSGVCGYHLAGFTPGVHVGMPSPALTLVVAIGEPIVVSTAGSEPRAHEAMIAGLHDRAAHIHHDGNQHGVQLDLTPAGARALLGCPASELAGHAIDLVDVLGPAARSLPGRAADAGTWPERVAVVLDVLTRAIGDAGEPRPEVAHAWREVCRTHGRIPVRAVAAAVGWSPRHLADRFKAEYGLGVKTAARVARFHRSSRLLASGRRAIADVAAECGYADQAHLTREWRELAGTTPARWHAEDHLAFVQDDEPASARR